MQYIFKASVALHLESMPNNGPSKVKATDILLTVPENLPVYGYLEDGLPNERGCKAITSVLVAGLVANIHTCHQKGFKDSAEHLREIIKQLEEGFVTVGNVTEGKFGGNKDNG